MLDICGATLYKCETNVFNNIDRRGVKMSKLVYGKNGQVRFANENEKKEAIEYILNSSNVNFNVHEDNQNQGAWASEERIHFKKEEDVPNSLKKLMTAGRPGLYGRINCKDFCEEVRAEAKKRGK